MAFQVSVIVSYVFPGVDAERSTGFTIEQETPISRADIAGYVEAVVMDLVDPRLSDPHAAGALPLSYSWEIESVFEF